MQRRARHWWHSAVAAMVCSAAATAVLGAPQAESDANVIVTLEKAVEGPRGPADLKLDFNRVDGKWDTTVWGYAPRYSGMDHRGTVAVADSGTLDSGLKLEVKLTLAAMPTAPKLDLTAGTPATFTIDLKRTKDGITGTYKGSVDGKAVEGKLTGRAQEAWRQKVAGFTAPKAGEHPRLAFREADIDALKARAKTPEGQQIIKRINATMNVGKAQGSTQYEGYNAAGKAFLFHLDGDPAHAEAARLLLVQRILAFPANKRLSSYERAARLMGVAMAYDVGYDAWDADFRKRVAGWLQAQSEELLAATVLPGLDNRRDRWHTILRGAVAMASMAMLGDPEADDRAAERLAIARRSIKHYLDDAVGDGGFDPLGDTAQLIALCHGLLPVMQASRITLGEELTAHPHFQWVYPLLVARIVPGAGMPTFGPGAAPEDITGFLALGMSSVPDKFKPAVMWLFDKQRGSTFWDITLPHHGMYAFTNLLTDTRAAPPGEVVPKAIIDRQSGYVLFRSRWQDQDDIAVALNLELNGSPPMSNPGAFRIAGLGNRWVDGDDRYPRQDAMVYLQHYNIARGAKLAYFKAEEDGSGVVTIDMTGVYEKPARIKVKNGNKDAEQSTASWPALKAKRSFGVDYSGKSGAPALIAVVDTFSGGGDVERNWHMRIERSKADGSPTPPVDLARNTFSITGAEGSATMKGTVVAPAGADLAWSEKERFRHKVSVPGENAFFIIMTLQKGPAPQVKVEGEGLNATVKVGDQTVRFDGDKIVFGK